MVSFPSILILMKKIIIDIAKDKGGNHFIRLWRR